MAFLRKCGCYIINIYHILFRILGTRKFWHNAIIDINLDKVNSEKS